LQGRTVPDGEERAGGAEPNDNDPRGKARESFRREHFGLGREAFRGAEQDLRRLEPRLAVGVLDLRRQRPLARNQCSSATAA
jgi:hypothetical protein